MQPLYDPAGRLSAHAVSQLGPAATHVHPKGSEIAIPPVSLTNVWQRRFCPAGQPSGDIGRFGSHAHGVDGIR